MRSVSDSIANIPLTSLKGACLPSSAIKYTAMRAGAVTRRDDILKVLREARSLLDAFGVARVALFGSFARDEGREDSDVDLLVEFRRPIGLFEFVRMQRQLGELLGHRVDLVTPAALKPQLRDRILREAVVAA
jgi:uncharacterized protein